MANEAFPARPGSVFFDFLKVLLVWLFTCLVALPLSLSRFIGVAHIHDLHNLIRRLLHIRARLLGEENIYTKREWIKEKERDR